MTAVGHKPAMGWARHLALVGIERSVLHVAPQPGHRDLIGFFNDHRRDQLAQLIKPILGRPVRVELDAAVTMNPTRPSQRQPEPGQRPGADAPTRHADRTDRARAMELPLVKEVLKVFDATLLHASRMTVEPRDHQPTGGPDDDPSGPDPCEPTGMLKDV